MEEENKKSKQQYNIEKENENIINALVEEIMNHSTDTKFLIDFIQKVREYRNKVYELKMNLGDTITEAYEVKKGKKLEKIKEELKIYEDIKINCSITELITNEQGVIECCEAAILKKKYPIQQVLQTLLYYKDKRLVIDSNNTIGIERLLWISFQRN